MISVKKICDSRNCETGDRLTTFLLVYPRYIHAEIMTHRVMSRNAASSRAIPVNKFRLDVLENPVIPVHWSANQKGMQADAELDDLDHIHTIEKLTAREYARKLWLEARDHMVDLHRKLEVVGLHKQIANRLLEPHFHISLLVSATEWENFFSLRCHKDAHPDIQNLADSMLDTYVNSDPVGIEPGQWHLPFGDQDRPEGVDLDTIIKVCVARAARISYKTFEGTIDIAADLALHAKLRASGHLSPFEHVAQAMRPEDYRLYPWSGNFKGFHQYRKQFADENRQMDLKALWAERKALRAAKEQQKKMTPVWNS